MVDREARLRIEQLEEEGLQRNREIGDLSARLSRWAAELLRVGAMVETLSHESPGVFLPSPAIHPKPPTPAPVATPAIKPTPANASIPAAPSPRPAVPSRGQPPAPSTVARLPAPPGFASLIVADFPALLDEFRGKRFTLLWRGSRDGFKANDFHHRCDGHANTLTLILEMQGNIFGGFTPVEWKSHGGSAGDPSLRSFIFTLKNPSNVPPMKFPLKSDQSRPAIICDASRGPGFGGPDYGDIEITSRCAEGAKNGSGTYYFGSCYANNSGRDARKILTGSYGFTVKEIEVFEIGS
jgi:hypothetical protein